MKKFNVLLLVLSLGIALVYGLSKFGFSKKETKQKLEFGERSENSELRKARELRMLADPATGQLPEGIHFLERAFLENMQANSAQRGSSVDWVSRGPYNYGGRTRAFVQDIDNENRLLAGGVSGGIWLSEDAGATWTRRSNINLHPGVVSIAQDKRPGHTNKWYALSGELTGTSASGGGAFYLGDGLFKSLDNGLNWVPVASTAGGNQHSFTTLYQGGWRVVCGTNPNADELYMATYGTIFRSANGGTSWTAVKGGFTADFSYYADVTITSTGVLYATLSSDGTDKGFWRSTDGTNWTDITPANMSAEYDRFVMGINPDNENEVYFLGSTPESGHLTVYIDREDWTSLWKYTYVSGNGSGAGGTWEDLSQNLPSDGTEFDQFSAQGGYDLVVKVQPGTGNVFVGGTNLYRSTDAFATANNTTKIGGYKIGTTLPFFEIYPNHHPDVHDVFFSPSNANVLFCASDGGLHRTDDALAPFVEWTSLNNGYQTTQFYTAIIDHNAPEDETIIGGLQDNGNLFAQSFGADANWTQTVNGDGAHGAIAKDKKYYILSIQQGRVAKCAIDADGTVTAFRRIDPIGPLKTDYDFINPLAMDPNDDNILYLPAGRNIYRNNDLANIDLTGEWDSIAQGWTKYPDSVASGTITTLAVSRSNPMHRVYFGTDENEIFRIDDAHTGTPNFTAIAPPSNNADLFVSCIAIDPLDADHIVLVYSNYNIYSLWESKDAGGTWTKVGGSLEPSVGGTGNGPSIRYVSILPMPDGSRRYFAGTSIGLFSTDTLIAHNNPINGTVWEQEAKDQIGSTVVSYVETRVSDGLVIAATHGNGLFSTNYFDFVSAKTPKAADIGLKTWPNPVSNTLYLDLKNKAYEGKQFQIFDGSGKLVRSLRLTQGQQQVDVSVLPAGLYQATYGLRFVKK